MLESLVSAASAARSTIVSFVLVFFVVDSYTLCKVALSSPTVCLNIRFCDVWLDLIKELLNVLPSLERLSMGPYYRYLHSRCVSGRAKTRSVLGADRFSELYSPAAVGWIFCKLAYLHQKQATLV